VRRREFATLFAGAAVSLPLAAPGKRDRADEVRLTTIIQRIN
jgi:hypothetical protein